mmetsp:Transcript_29946/g.49420  ORF Transcript_29946/g.49420 Transcript_29946/m.49420 type:complete len:285 (-) Transcript_29946:137-991(-)
MLRHTIIRFTLLLVLLVSVSAKIEIIGAGLGRTGTLSLQAALEELGYKGYHFVDFSHAQQWADVANGERNVDTVIDLMVQNGFTATMDNPAADIYVDLFRRFPDARVILSVRDSPEIFARSWKTLYEAIEVTERDFAWNFPSFFQWIPTFRYLKEMRCMMGTTHLGLKPCELLKNWDQHDDGWIEEQYERHNQHVVDTIPEDQLLVFDVKEGWVPLCEFLDKPVPDQPFPHVKVNNAAGMKDLRQMFILVIYCWVPLVLAIILLASLCCCRSRPAALGGKKKSQ